MGEIIIFFYTDLVSCSYYVFSSYITEVILLFFSFFDVKEIIGVGVGVWR